MQLIDYKLTVPATVGTMDKYFNLMFRAKCPHIDSDGNITDPYMKHWKRQSLIKALEELSKAHPVLWAITVSVRGRRYVYKANNGIVEYKQIEA